MALIITNKDSTTNQVVSKTPRRGATLVPKTAKAPDIHSNKFSSVTIKFDPAVWLSLSVITLTVMLALVFMKFTIGSIDFYLGNSNQVAIIDENQIFDPNEFRILQDEISLESKVSLNSNNNIFVSESLSKKQSQKEIIDSIIDLSSDKKTSDSKSIVSQVYQIISSTNRKQKNAMQLARAIVSESARQKFDPLFVAAVMKSESAFNELAVSHVGAQGLMQIMPATGKYLINKHKEEDFPAAVKLTDTNVNIKLGIKYLRELEKMYAGNRLLVLIAYNWGPGKLDRAIRDGRGVPKECIKYALKILKDHNLWQA